MAPLAATTLATCSHHPQPETVVASWSPGYWRLCLLLFERNSSFAGVPENWLIHWAGAFKEAKDSPGWRLFSLPALASLSVLAPQTSPLSLLRQVRCGRLRWPQELPCSLASSFSPWLPLQIGCLFRSNTLKAQTLRCTDVLF